LEARFILLHPDDPGEILSATALIRCLRTQVDGALVYSVVKDEHRWILEHDPHLDEIFPYRKAPEELADQLVDFLPDYLIDLNGSREVRRFKNRLKILDFTISRKLSAGSWDERAFATCRLFDVQDDGTGARIVTNDRYKELLPGGFLEGYLVLSLDSDHMHRQMTDEQIIEMVVMTEKPIVVTGGLPDRRLADRIGQSTGCAVFPTCGDLDRPEIASVIAHANGIIAFDPLWSRAAEAAGVKGLTIISKQDSANLRDLALWARSLFNPDHERNTI
jgi:ADP-heptose:LPS heptosyltransferase